MTIARWLAIAAVFTFTIASGHSAQAQRAEADALFVEGKRLMKEGKIAEACEKLEASEHLESSVGTLLNLGDCRERNHQPASAWAAFRKAAANAKRAGNDTKRETEARRRAAALDKRLDYLTITVATPVDGVVVRRDNADVERALWNDAVPVDPGTYAITAEAPGYKPFSRSVTIDGEGKRESISVGLEPEPKPVVTAPVKPAAAPVAAPAQPRAAEPAGMSGKRKAAIAIAIVGVGAAAAGVAFGVAANHAEDQANAICPGTTCPDAHAVQLNKDARDDALYANLGFVTAGVAVVGAAVLWFVGGPAEHDHVAVAPLATGGVRGLALEGRF